MSVVLNWTCDLLDVRGLLPAMPACWATNTTLYNKGWRTSKSQILSFARQVNERESVGHRGAVLMSNGQTMVEEPTIGKQRAEQIAMLLQGANLKEPAYKVRWQDSPAQATGVDDYLSRRAVVTVRSR
jgi:hypothetical protein